MSFLPLFVGVGFALTLQCLNRALDWLPAWAGPSGKYAAQDRHKWRNAATSTFNSAIISCLVVNCLYHYPEVWGDMRYFYTQSMDVAFSANAGYYVYDLYDLLSFNKFASIWPLMIHHFACLFVLLSQLYLHDHVGLLMVALLFELHAVLLHLRQILLMHGVSRQSRFFRCHKIIHVFAFVFLRLAPFVYVAYRVWTDTLCGLYDYMLVPITSFILFINLVLFRRVIYNDFVRKDKSESDVNILER